MNRPPFLTELPYRPDSAALFEAVADQPWSLFLDSGRPKGAFGRYDILCVDPMATLVTCGDSTEVRTTSGMFSSAKNPFELLRELLGPALPVTDLPFVGGAVGYFAYDLARRLERLPSHAEDSHGFPEMAVGIYDWALVVDHQERRSRLVGQGRDPRTRERWEALVDLFSSPGTRPPHPSFLATGQITSNLTAESYGAAFRRIHRYIREGDCYQVNFAQCFSVPVIGSPWEGYRRLRTRSPAPFGAYLNLPMGQILSVSPERFLSVRDQRVETRPIKGTRPRGADHAEDRALASALLDSPKDRAENLMIVDLLRNDLGKNCATGSVRVPALFQLESYPNVHHLVSTVVGQLAPERDALHLLEGCFPGGSITGAPKLRAMEIIEELEPHRRGIYCGAIGYLGFDGVMDTNIAIRTLTVKEGTARFWAGGGIVADSDPDEEYQETFDKVSSFLRFFRQS